MIPIKSQIENPNADVETLRQLRAICRVIVQTKVETSPWLLFYFPPFSCQSVSGSEVTGVSLLPSLRCDQDFVLHCNFCRVCEQLSIVCPDLTCTSYQICQDVIILPFFSFCHYFCHHLRFSGLVPQPLLMSKARLDSETLSRSKCVIKVK